MALGPLNYLYSRVLTMKRSSWFAFILLLSISCLDSPDCFELNHNLVGISFRVMGTGKPDTLRFYNIKISGTDSIFIPSQTAIAIGLPLDFTHDDSKIFFEGYRGKDTLHLSYRVSTQFVSEDCGSRFILTNLDTLHSSFDSVRIVNRSPGNRPPANIEIYRCPRTDTMAIAFRQLTITSTGVRSSTPMSMPLDGVTPDFTGQTLYADQRPSIIYLPVNLASPNMVLNFVLEGSLPRELKLAYTLQNGVRFRPCGEQTYVTTMQIQPSAENLAFDSVSFVRDAAGRPVTSVLDPFDPMINVYRCPQVNIAGIYFRKSGGGADTVMVNEVRVDGVAMPLVSNSIQSINVPLNPTAATTTVAFDFQSGETRSLTISHTRVDRVAFPACGTQGFYSQLALSATDFDTVGTAKDIKFPVTTLQSIPTKNIEILLR